MTEVSLALQTLADTAEPPAHLQYSYSSITPIVIRSDKLKLELGFREPSTYSPAAHDDTDRPVHGHEPCRE